MASLGQYVTRLRKWKHRNIRTGYNFNPKEGSAKPQYRCPFCGRMTHADRFLKLEIPKIESSVIFYGGYRGIKILKVELSSETRSKVLKAMKQKIEWLYEKIGGENLWLKSKSVSILAALATSTWTMAERSKPLLINVSPSHGLIKSTKTGVISLQTQEKQSK